MRDVLNRYILDPELYPNDVVFYDDNVTIIYDKYPKSVVHFLVLVRDGELTFSSPFTLLSNQSTIDLLRPYVDRAMLFAAMHLKAIKNDHPSPAVSFPHQVTKQLLEEYEPYMSRIKAGFHALPSLANSHVHIISKDNYSPSLKYKNHYNSFNSAFFIPFRTTADPSLAHVTNGHIHELLQINDMGPMHCHTCHKECSSMGVLKKHLEHEFQTWKKS